MIDVKKKYPDKERSWEWFLKHHDELVEQYSGKYLLIVDEQVVGAYDEYKPAYVEGYTKYPDKFLVQRCSPGDEDIVINISNPFLQWRMFQKS